MCTYKHLYCPTGSCSNKRVFKYFQFITNQAPNYIYTLEPKISNRHTYTYIYSSMCKFHTDLSSLMGCSVLRWLYAIVIFGDFAALIPKRNFVFHSPNGVTTSALTIHTCAYIPIHTHTHTLTHHTQSHTHTPTHHTHTQTGGCGCGCSSLPVAEIAFSPSILRQRLHTEHN